MFVATLLCNPKDRMDPALPEAIRNAWGGGDLIWLSPDQAAEFVVPERPGNWEEVWRTCQDQRVDLAVTPADNRRKKLLIADMDSTLIQQECIDELAEEAGVGAHVADITARAMNGEIEFNAALEERVALLKGLPLEIIDQVIGKRITFMPGGDVLVSTMKHSGAYAMVVSGGFTEFTSRIAATLGFDKHQANILEHENGVLTGTVGHPILGRDAKVDALEEQSERLHLRPADAIAVGDGANDLGMLGRAGLGVALHAKPAVQAQCDIRINFGDLSALLYLQGYTVGEFVHSV